MEIGAANHMNDFPPTKLSGVEALKARSDLLRGDLTDELAAGGSQVSEDGYNLLKFHGSYEQYDRDTATALKQRGEEKDYSFMVRVRMPGGSLTSAQYLALDALADRHANATLRITTRQGIQFHYVPKHELKPAIVAINAALLTTLAACGDVARNVMTTPAPLRDAVHARLEADAHRLSAHLLPKTRAYHEIFLDGEKVDLPESEPLYGATYLPRKFKISLTVPEDNTVDVLSNDLGLIALFEGETLTGYNIAVGGGQGMTHNRADTFPAVAQVVGFVEAAKLLAAVEAVISLQRDHGDRSDRRRARLKYVVHDRGLDWVRSTLIEQYGLALLPARPMPEFLVPDHLGWHAQGDGLWWLGVPVPSGRIADQSGVSLRSALRAVMAETGADPVMTPQQDILLTNIRPEQRDEVDAILQYHHVVPASDLTPLARWTLACPALPTCGLALTEAERVRGPIVADVQAALDGAGLGDQRISLRITGCPNGCARSYTGDIGLVGRIPGQYALFVGGDFAGTVLSMKLIEKLPVARIGATLAPLFAAWGQVRAADPARDLGFGDWCRTVGEAALLALLGREEKAA